VVPQWDYDVPVVYEALCDFGDLEKNACMYISCRSRGVRACVWCELCRVQILQLVYLEVQAQKKTLRNKPALEVASTKSPMLLFQFH
jgi:hypothetical protein